MANAAFDTLATARLLRESGFEERQAAAITTAIKDGVTGGVATKADLAELRGAMAHDLAELDSRLETRFSQIDTRIARLETDMTWVKRIGAVIVALLAVPIVRDLLSSLN